MFAEQKVELAEKTLMLEAMESQLTHTQNEIVKFYLGKIKVHQQILDSALVMNCLFRLSPYKQTNSCEIPLKCLTSKVKLYIH